LLPSRLGTFGEKDGCALGAIGDSRPHETPHQPQQILNLPGIIHDGPDGQRRCPFNDQVDRPHDLSAELPVAMAAYDRNGLDFGEGVILAEDKSSGRESDDAEP
jgi:hypothetical protein